MRLFSLLRRTLPGMLGVSMLVPAQAFAQDGFLFNQPSVTLSVRGGHHMATAGSDLYDQMVETLTLERGDFSGFTLIGELGVRLSPRLDVVGSVGRVQSDIRSESRTHTADPEILQSTTLRRTPVSATLKYYPFDRGRAISSNAWIPARFTPYIGAGIGATHHDLRQDGEFVDYLTCDENNACDIVELVLESSGWGPSLHVAAGADYWLTSRLALTGDARYQWGSAELDHFSYGDFDDIDLGGLQATIGLSVRF